MISALMMNMTLVIKEEKVSLSSIYFGYGCLVQGECSIIINIIGDILLIFSWLKLSNGLGHIAI